MTQKASECQRKLKVVRYADKTRHVGRTCRYCGIGRANSCCRKAVLEKLGEAGLVRKRPIPKNPKNRTPPEIAEKVLHLRKTGLDLILQITVGYCWFADNYIGCTTAFIAIG